jgi:hypothetical protein
VPELAPADRRLGVPRGIIGQLARCFGERGSNEPRELLDEAHLPTDPGRALQLAEELERRVVSILHDELTDRGLKSPHSRRSGKRPPRE